MTIEEEILMDIDKFKEYILDFTIFQDPAECHEYINYHYRRFLKTLKKIPERRGKLLEIGAAPFCMTLMIQAVREYEIHLINYGSQGSVNLKSDKYSQYLSFPCHGINVECDAFPYEDGQFDVVVCAEVIEHLTFNPTNMLNEIHRVLKPNGLLILTTPNVLRLFYNYHNTRNIIHGINIYDPYSGYGPYGRHNREFTPFELQTLVEGCGYTINEIEVCDTNSYTKNGVNKLYRLILSLLFKIDREILERYRGSQIIITAYPRNEKVIFLPEILYKSISTFEKAREVFPRIP